jgi:hypothetical protein
MIVRTLGSFGRSMPLMFAATVAAMPVIRVASNSAAIRPLV